MSDSIFRPKTISKCCKALGNGIVCEVRSHLVYKCLSAWKRGNLRVKVFHDKINIGWAVLEPDGSGSIFTQRDEEKGLSTEQLNLLLRQMDRTGHLAT